MAEGYYGRLPRVASSEGFVRVRKPPGGDTSDIFNLEQRQREQKLAIYMDSRKENSVGADSGGRKCRETEDIPSPRCNSSAPRGGPLRRSLSEGKLGLDRARSPPLAPGKENLGAHFPGAAFLVESRDELETRAADRPEDPTKKPRRPCIRVRQPPGGKSSIVF